MSFTDILISLVPALGWGLVPILASLSGANPKEQLLGTAISTLILGIITFLVVKPLIVFPEFFISVISGLFWAIGQFLVFKSFQLTDVSKAMPISTGTQLIGSVLFSAFVFGEWSKISSFVLGIASLLVIVVGIYFTSYSSKKGEGISTKAILTLLLSSSSLVLYIVINKFFGISGFDIILPQSIGIFLATLVICYVNKGSLGIKKVLLNLTTGFSWSIANICMFVASASVGVATAFTLSQINVVVATLGSIVILKESKTSQEKKFILRGIVMILIGAFVISTLK